MTKVKPLNSFVSSYLNALARRGFKRAVFTIVILVTMLCGWFVPKLEFDFEFEKLFPKDDPDAILFKAHTEEFGYDNDFLNVIINSESGIFNKKFLNKVSSFEKLIDTIPDVESVTSPLPQKRVVKTPLGLSSFPLVHLDEPDRLALDSSYIFSHPLYRQAFSDDGKAILVFLQHEHFDDGARSDALVGQLKKAAEKANLDNVLFVGKLVAQNEFIEFIKKDFSKFLIGSVLLSFTLLWLIFRDLRSALLPFTVSIVTLIWLFGFLVMIGYKVNLLSALIPPIIFFVSMSDVIHLMNAYKKTQETDVSLTLREAVSIVWTPTFLTSVTTAIGFLSLLWLKTEPLQQLGLFAALGVLLAFVVTFTLGLLLLTKIPIVSGRVIGIPVGYSAFLKKNKIAISTTVIALILVCVPGISKLKVNAYLLDDLPPHSEIRQNFLFADNQLGGSKPWEIRVQVADTSLTIWDREVMDELNTIETYLSEEYPINRIQSPVTVMKYANSVNNGGLSEHYAYPQNERSYQRALKLIEMTGFQGWNSMISVDQRVARISGFFPELGSAETSVKNDSLLSYLERRIDPNLVSYNITGTTYLIDKTNGLLSINLMKGLVTAVAIIAIILGLYFRSWKLLLISLIPNILPLLIIAGILGWLGISLKMTTAIIFTVAFGIAVDDTIHFMSYYLRNLNSSDAPLDGTFKHAGSAMLITSIVIVAGFALFTLSDFGATFYMGLFVSMSLIAALIIDLTLLPLLLNRFVKNAK